MIHPNKRPAGRTEVLELGTCAFCGTPSLLEVDFTDIPLIHQWRRGQGLIHNVLSHWTPGRREQLLSGSHEECFDKYLGEDALDDYPEEDL